MSGKTYIMIIIYQRLSENMQTRQKEREEREREIKRDRERERDGGIICFLGHTGHHRKKTTNE